MDMNFMRMEMNMLKIKQAHEKISSDILPCAYVSKKYRKIKRGVPTL